MGMCLTVYWAPVQFMLMENNSLNCFVAAFDEAYEEFQRLK